MIQVETDGNIQKSLFFLQHLLTMIPRTIHQIWMQGQEVLPAKYQAFQQTWKQEKDFHYELWDQQRIENLLVSSNNPEWQRIYNLCTTLIQKVDFGKYVILYTFGGIYVDMDVFSVKSVIPALGQSLSTFVDSIEEKGHSIALFPHNGPYFTVLMNKMMGLRGNTIVNNAVI